MFLFNAALIFPVVFDVCSDTFMKKNKGKNNKKHPNNFLKVTFVRGSRQEAPRRSLHLTLTKIRSLRLMCSAGGTQGILGVTAELQLRAVALSGVLIVYSPRPSTNTPALTRTEPATEMWVVVNHSEISLLPLRPRAVALARLKLAQN